MYEDAIEDIEKFTTEQNINTMKFLVKEHNLGPDKANENWRKNIKYFQKLAKAMDIEERDAYFINCGNCRYSIKDPVVIEKLDKIPLNKFDLDGGGRVWCDKYEFICHNLRVCDSWEGGRLPSEAKDDEKTESIR